MSEPPPPPPGAPPPPPPPPPPASSGASFSVGDAISYGWTAYWRNVGPMVLIALVIFGVNVVIAILSNVTDSTIGRIILQIISFVIGMILAMGLIRASLAVCRGETPEVSMLFETEGLWPYVLAAIIFGLAVALGLVLCIVPGVFLLVIWQFFGYFIVEEPSTGATDALRRSSEMTKGHRWELLGLIVLLFLINVAGLLACGVGLLFTYGITAIAVAYAYKTLSGQAVAPV
jgi:uncharacterized membrane protein